MRALLPLVALALATMVLVPQGDAEGARPGREAPRSPTAPGASAIQTTATALEIAQAMAVDPAMIYAAEFVELPPQGSPTGVSTTLLAKFPTHESTFGILSTGNAAFASSPNSSPGTSAMNGGGNVRGNSDFDVVILKVQLRSLATHFDTCVSFDFRFLTEEYPEFVGSEYNDAFIAESGLSTWTTQDSVITAPNNFAWRTPDDIVSVTPGNANAMSASAAVGTTYDGATPVYRAAALVVPTLVGLDVVYDVYFSIFDQGDSIYDSAVFLDNLDLYMGGCATGATQIAT